MRWHIFFIRKWVNVGISGIIEQLASKRKLGALVMMTRIKRPIIRSIISGIINKLKDLSGSWFDNHQWKDADLWYDGGSEPDDYQGDSFQLGVLRVG